MKKNRSIFVTFVILALIALVLWLTQSQTTFRRSLSDFTLNDSSNVTKIFMSDKNNNSVTLTKISPGKWLVNDKYPAQKLSVEMLLKTMVMIEVQQPVANAAHDNIVKELLRAHARHGGVKRDLGNVLYAKVAYAFFALFRQGYKAVRRFIGEKELRGKGEIRQSAACIPFKTVADKGLNYLLMTEMHAVISAYGKEYGHIVRRVKRIADQFLVFPVTPSPAAFL